MTNLIFVFGNGFSFYQNNIKHQNKITTAPFGFNVLRALALNKFPFFFFSKEHSDESGSVVDGSAVVNGRMVGW